MPFASWVRCLAVDIAVLGAAFATGVGLAPAEQTGAREQVRPVSAKTFLDTPEPRGDRSRLCLAIFARNLMVYTLLLCGLASAGITAISVLAFNGLSIGELLGAAHASGVPLDVLMATTLPHGIPEFSAFLLAAAIGLRGPALFAAWMRGALPSQSIFKLWPIVSVGVCIVAAGAFIEAYWTIPMARLLLS